MAIEDSQPSAELAEIADTAQEKADTYDQVTDANLAANSVCESTVTLDDEADDIADGAESMAVSPAVEVAEEDVAPVPVAHPIAKRAIVLADADVTSSAVIESTKPGEVETPMPHVQNDLTVAKPVEAATVTASKVATIETRVAPAERPVVPDVQECSEFEPIPEDEDNEGDSQSSLESLLLDKLDDEPEDEPEKSEWFEEFEVVPPALREEFTAKVPKPEDTKRLIEKANPPADSESEADEPYEEIEPLSNSDAVLDDTNVDYARDIADQIEFTEKPETIARVKAVAEGLEPPFRSPGALACMYQLAKQLQPHFTEFDTLIVDDISGRIPALVYRKLINDARAAEGLPPTETYFVNGKYGLLINDPLSRDFTAPEGRILVFTEFASSAFAALNLYNAILNNQPEAQVDIAAIGVYRPMGAIRTHLETGSNLYIGDNGPAMGELLYHTSKSVRYKGVFKTTDDIIGRREPGDVYDGAIVARAREEAKYVANAFAEILAETEEDKR
jgi:hypothetical protein